MKLLIVDDQKKIVESFRRGIDWKRIGISLVYTACSAREARMILTNLGIDILLSDIEMPEEDGIALTAWTKENFPHIECIFLTSHAEFTYAKEAIRLGSFDYILQPARFEEVERVISRAVEKIQATHKIMKLRDSESVVLKQRNMILDSVLTKLVQNKEREAEKIFTSLPEIFRLAYDTCSFTAMSAQIVRWRRNRSGWTESLIMLVLQNVLEELLEDCQGKCSIACQMDYGYVIMIAAEERLMTSDRWNNLVEEFYRFINRHMDFEIAVYPGDQLDKNVVDVLRGLLSAPGQVNPDKRPGIYWESSASSQRDKLAETDVINMAMAYVKDNLSKNISRAEVASLVCLNEDYFSRLFKQHTGLTFKNYVLNEKMSAAKVMLEQTRLSVSIIASKVGFDNFSHFSKMFKKHTETTPQEYRRDRQSFNL